MREEGEAWEINGNWFHYLSRFHSFLISRSQKWSQQEELRDINKKCGCCFCLSFSSLLLQMIHNLQKGKSHFTISIFHLHSVSHHSNTLEYPLTRELNIASALQLFTSSTPFKSFSMPFRPFSGRYLDIHNSIWGRNGKKNTRIECEKREKWAKRSVPSLKSSQVWGWSKNGMSER